MIPVVITQRVVESGNYKERRDCLDQRWSAFLYECGLLPISISNVSRDHAEFFKDLPIKGIILTGGNTLAKYGGDAPERDNLENNLINYAIDKEIPLIGVCRGMQMIQNYYNIPLHSIEGHVAAKQELVIKGRGRTIVNSYHSFGSCTTVSELAVWARTSDGIVKAIRHTTLPIVGIMWHPERMGSFTQDDIELFRNFFKGNN